MSRTSSSAALPLLVPVMPSASLKAWPTHVEGGRVQYVPLASALNRRWATDAHSAAYSVPSVARRLDSNAPERIEGGVRVVLLIVDVDCPAAHKKGGATPEAWRDEQRARIVTLRETHPEAFAFETRGGLRLMARLAEPHVIVGSRGDASAEVHRQWYLRQLGYLARRYGIVGDASCSDWSRLFRLPHVVRDGVAQEHPTHGTTPGAWSYAPNAADDAADLDAVRDLARDRGGAWEAARRHLEPTARAPRREPLLGAVGRVGAASHNADTKRACAYFDAALPELLRGIVDAPDGNQNNTIRDNSMRAFRLALAAGIDLDTVADRLADAAHEGNHPETRAAATITSSRRAAEREGPAKLADRRMPQRPRRATTMDDHQGGAVAPESTHETASTADPLDGLAADILANGRAERALEPDVVAALAALRDADAPAFDGRMRELKAAGASMGRLNDEIKAHQRAAKQARTAARRRTDPPRTAPIDAALPVVMDGPDLARVGDEALAALAGVSNLYQRNGELVRITIAPGVPPLDADADAVAKRAHERAVRCSPGEGSPIIGTVPAAALTELLSSAVEFRRVRHTREGATEHRVAPPEGLAVRLCARGTYDSRIIRPLVAVVESPPILPSGRVLTAPGYDHETGIELRYRGDPLDVPEHLTQDDARCAAEHLAELFCDFTFEGGEEAQRIALAGVLAAILTPLARPSFDGPAPGFIFDARDRSAGKTLVVRTVGSIALGREPALRAWSEDRAEIEKVLGTLALHAPTVAVFDNVCGRIDGGALAAVVTSTTYAFRILGASAEVERPWRTVLYFTANDAEFCDDTALRFVRVFLVKRAAPRPPFRFELPGHAIEHRDAYLRDALMILRAHALAGRPEPTDRPAAPYVEKFPAWCRAVASAVWWAFGYDPCRAVVPESSNVERTLTVEVLRAWAVALGSRPITLAALRDRIAAGEPALRHLRDALADLAGVPDFSRASSRSLGRRLEKLADRAHAAPWGGTMRLDKGTDAHTKVNTYAVVCSVAPLAPYASPRANDDGDRDRFEIRGDT